MVTFLTVSTAITLTEAFSAGALMGLTISHAIRNKQLKRVK